MDEVILKERMSTKVFIFKLIIDLVLCIFYIGIIFLIDTIIKYCTTTLTITDKSVKGKVGLINSKELDSPLNKINSVDVSSGLVDKMLNCGTITITTASSVFKFKNINNPKNFKNVLLEQIEKYDDERIKKQAVELAKAMK